MPSYFGIRVSAIPHHFCFLIVNVFNLPTYILKRSFFPRLLYLEDNSVLRRGQPVAHKVYGIPSTINSANYVMFIGLERVLDLDHPQAVHVFCQQMLELHRGQGIELYWRDNPDFQCPTEEEYEKMTIQKTGRYIIK